MSFYIDDLDLFFLDFAVDVEWAGGSSSSGSFKGIFDDEYTFLDASTGEIETSSPQVLVKASDVVGIQHGDSITVDSRGYTVTGIQPNGTGLTTLILKV